MQRIQSWKQFSKYTFLCFLVRIPANMGDGLKWCAKLSTLPHFLSVPTSCVRPQGTLPSKRLKRDFSSYNLYLLSNPQWWGWKKWFDTMPCISGARSCFLPESRAPCPPFFGWNDPLCKFLCSTVMSTITFQPSTFTFRTFVWNCGTWNLPLTTPSSCLPL